MSIRKKLIIIILGITFLTLSTGFVFVSAHAYHYMRENLAATAIKNAELMGQYSIVPLTFGDRAQAEKNLAVLRKIPSIKKAVIYDNGRNLFASYRHTAANQIPAIEFNNRYQGFENGFFHVFRPIVHEKQFYGTVYLAVSSQSLVQEIKRNILIFAVSLFGLMAVAALLASIFQKTLTAPILKLADVMGRITTEPDYATRMEGARNDEIGTLYDGFNRMLERIEEGQKELKAERDFSTGIIRSTPTLICGISPSGTTTFINPAGESITGYRRDEIIGKNWWQTFFPKDSYRQAEKLFSHFKKGDVRNHEITMTAKGGLKRIILWNFLNKTGTDGNLIEITGFGTDITQRKQAEEKIRHLRNYLVNIIDSMPSVLVGVDNETRITQWNREAEKQTGIGQREAMGRYIIDVFPRMAAEMEKIKIAMRNRQAQESSKVLRQCDGETRYENVTVYPLLTNGVEGAVIRVDDVTERVRLEDMMIQSEKMLSVGGLAAGMAHEINNPLAGIIQNAEMVQRRLTEDLPSNQKAAEAAGTSMDEIRAYLESRRLNRMLSHIHTSGHRAAEIVKNMLSFARKGGSNFAAHDLAKLLDQSVSLAKTDYDLKKQYDFRQIKIVREYDPGLSKIRCEASKIQQVFLNILKNGAEAMAENIEAAPQFILRLMRDNDMVRVEVEDNGPGMEEAVRRRLFEPFFTTKAVGVGTGLGMSVSYFIITENHGGEMKVESTPGHGTKFTIRLQQDSDKAGAGQ